MTVLLEAPAAATTAPPSVGQMLICANRMPTPAEAALLRTGIQQLADQNTELRAQVEQLKRRLRDANARIAYDQITAHRHHHQET